LSRNDPQYQADKRVLIVVRGESDSTLELHEDRGDETPRCGTRNDPWRDRQGVLHQMEYKSLGAGDVTCRSCGRLHQDATSHASRRGTPRAALAQKPTVRKIALREPDPRRATRRPPLPDLDRNLGR